MPLDGRWRFLFDPDRRISHPVEVDASDTVSATYRWSAGTELARETQLKAA
jgi:hypothetical protein